MAASSSSVSRPRAGEERATCGADIAAAGQTNVLPAKNAHQDKAKGNRPQEIAEAGSEEETHRFRSAGVPSAVGVGVPPTPSDSNSVPAAIRQSLAAGEDARRTAGGTPATPIQSVQSWCTARRPASAGSGTGRTPGRSSYQTRALASRPISPASAETRGSGRRL